MFRGSTRGEGKGSNLAGNAAGAARRAWGAAVSRVRGRRGSGDEADGPAGGRAGGRPLDGGEPPSGQRQRRRSKRPSTFKPRRAETQNMLASPDRYLQKFLPTDIFGLDVQPFKREHIEKEGKLEKQGNFFKTWHKRYFVLTNHNLSYYESKKKFRSNHAPFGVISFKDILVEGGQVVHDVPDIMVNVLQLKGKSNLFCIHISNRTYIMSAGSKDEKADWQRAITKAYGHDKKKSVAAAKRIHKSKPTAAFQGAEDIEELITQYDLSLARLRNTFALKRTIEAWKIYTEYSKNRRLDRDARQQRRTRTAANYARVNANRSPSFVELKDEPFVLDD